MDAILFTLSPLEHLVIGDNRVTTALMEENYGPPEHREYYIRERCKEARYETGEQNARLVGDEST